VPTSRQHADSSATLAELIDHLLIVFLSSRFLALTSTVTSSDSSPCDGRRDRGFSRPGWSGSMHELTESSGLSRCRRAADVAWPPSFPSCDLPRDTRDPPQTVELIDHRVDLCFTSKSRRDITVDLLREVAMRDRGSSPRDVADLGRQVARIALTFRQVFPGGATPLTQPVRRRLPSVPTSRATRLT